MKRVLAGVFLASFVGLVAAQDRLPREEARRYATACVEQLGGLGGAPVAVEPDPAKACAVRGEGGGAMVIPDRRLSQEKLARAGRDVLPLGQLWLRKWTAVAGGKAVARDRLRVVTVNLDDKDRPMPLFLLGVRKKGERALELVAYAAGGEPLLALPLRQVDFVPQLPLELDWQRGEKGVDALTLTVLGKYQAVMPVTRE